MFAKKNALKVTNSALHYRIVVIGSLNNLFYLLLICSVIEKFIMANTADKLCEICICCHHVNKSYNTPRLVN